VNKLVNYFRRIAVLDFEFEIEDGGLPRVLCLVVYILNHKLRHVDTIRLWRGEFGSRPPFDIDDDTLVVAYSAWAEMTCFLTLGWKFPAHVFDLHTAYLATSNILLPYAPDEKRIRPRKRLSDACKAYGIAGWDGIDKPQMAQDIGQGRWEICGQAEVMRYCEADVRASAELLRRQISGYGFRPPVDTHCVLNWSNYSAKAIARVQARGMPIDMRLWNIVQENQSAVVLALLRRFDPSFGHPEAIYTPDGEWAYHRFEQWLIRVGIAAWPRLPSGALDIDGDAFRLMYGVHPAIEGLHALRDALGVITKARISIGPDGRNRPSLFPFGTATGRNAHSKSLFNAHASMRSFMVFPKDTIAVYLDWRAQEIIIAGARSGDERMIADYASGDTYHALAHMCGLTTDTNIQRWKDECKDQRQRMKVLQLGISYGMGVRSLARGLDRHPLIGSEIIILHKMRYPRFWPWRADTAQQAMLDRAIYSEYDGWPMHLSTSPNQRTLFNLPMQSGGAEMLRLATCWLCDAGLVPSMLVHDGILLELQNREQIQQAKEIMRKAGAAICGGLEVGVDVDQQLENGARYRDKRVVAQKMWDVVMGVLIEIGAIPKVS
jgi:DNA polymerase-1